MKFIYENFRALGPVLMKAFVGNPQIVDLTCQALVE